MKTVYVQKIDDIVAEKEAVSAKMESMEAAINDLKELACLCSEALLLKGAIKLRLYSLKMAVHKDKLLCLCV